MTSAPPDEITTEPTAADLAESGAFTRPAPMPPAKAEALAQAERREDDPPPEVPRDQWERPMIVLLDGSGVESYLRASKLGKVKRSRALDHWHYRNIVYGMSRANHLIVRAQGVRTLVARPDIAVLEDIADKAEIVAGADAGAMTGSGMHALHARRAAGEDLSWLSPTTLECLDAITALLDPRIFEIIVTEGDDDLGRTFVVHDKLRAAGSFDLVVRLLVDLTWPDGVTIPRGTILVVDLKTGKITSAPYWDLEFTCQQLVYAEGWPYRPGTTLLADPQVRSVKNVLSVREQPGHHGRITWPDIGVPERPCQRWSLILHVPALSPRDAHWERVDLDQAREDAAAARRVWDRDKVGRAERFLALPAAALYVPGVDMSTMSTTARANAEPGPTGVGSSVDTDASTAARGEDHFNAKLHATLRERIRRADSTDKVDALYDAWGRSPTWDATLTADCQAVYDRLDSPPGCAKCDADRHECPGCGKGVAHGVEVCPACSLRVALDEAPDRAAIALLWDAHGPDGDNIWTEEHQVSGKARYRELPATDEYPDLHDEADETDADEPAAVHVGPSAIDGSDRFTDDPVPPADPRQYPMTIEQVGFGTITLWCHECLLPPEHPQADDPIAWCECDWAIGETHADGTACRSRAHAPVECPHYVPDEPNGPDGMAREPDAVNPVATEPGPFDGTMDLSDLRDLIEQALDTDTLDALYDAHCRVEEGGDGLWTDDLNPIAQAAYDRLSTGTGASS